MVTYLQSLVEANDVRVTKRGHYTRLAVQVRPDVLVLDLARVDNLYRHLAQHARVHTTISFGSSA